MRFAVIEGSREWTDAVRHVPADRVSASVQDVEAEARRRLKAARLDEWRNREFITGRPMPHEIRHFALQVEFARQAISRLAPIPEDFDDDVYWPKLWG